MSKTEKVEDLRRSYMKKILKKENVFEAALNRIRRLFDDFEEVVVSVSGGKDSTIVLELALIVAREKGRLPLKVFFLDQEVEWQATIDMVEDIMYREEVEPLWYQTKFRIINSASNVDRWLWCWDPEKEEKWIRPKSEISIKEDIPNVKDWTEMFPPIADQISGGKKMCFLAGMRAEESPMRLRGMTVALTYKDITWGKVLNKEKEHYTFYPIYDWTYIDVWKAIHDNQWKYCTIYDEFYRYGVPIQEMRVSNLNHETAVRSLYYLQEVEPDTYLRVCNRLDGIDASGKLCEEAYTCPKELPVAFSSWKEYRDYLVVNLLPEKWHKKFFNKFESMKSRFGEDKWIIRRQIASVLHNDHEFIKLRAVQLPRAKHAEWQARKLMEGSYDGKDALSTRK